MDQSRAAAAIEEFLRALGHDPQDDPELAATGHRVAEAFGDELLAGYAMDPAEILQDTCASDGRGGLVVLRDIATTAICPHHLLPATGVVHVAYRPKAKLIGLGALDRLVQCYARRLTLQEDLTQHIADALVEHLGAAAAGCVANLHQSCVSARGPKQSHARTLTMATAGDDDPDLRLALLR